MHLDIDNQPLSPPRRPPPGAGGALAPDTDAVDAPPDFPGAATWDALRRAIDEALVVQERAFSALADAVARHRVVSTLPLGSFDHWQRAVGVLAPRRNWLNPLTRPFDVPDIGLLFRLIRAAREADLVLLTGGERVDLFYALLLRWLGSVRTPHIFADAHWSPRRNWLTGWIQRQIHRSAAPKMVEVQPHSEEEVALYARNFGYRDELIRPIPWSTSLTGHSVEPERGDYVVSGGYSHRDYATLIAACRDAPIELRLGIPARSEVAREARALARGIPNVQVHRHWSNAEFIDQQARCGVFALPITPGLQRSTGDQTILNAMAWGKVVVATDSIGSRVYIRDGENGFLVRESDPAHWREVLQRVMTLDETAYTRIGMCAMWDARVRFGERLRAARTLKAALRHLDRSDTPGQAA
ncbi:glycosyltransferase [Pseudomarimonas salicorniae]|uniref:Glycosyltransferase n=1 Tax=Pseudomarimonas salicorniae TaxID=2933270 RepID=A0ABT0GKI3_9GAMM|nr:glycosyltransferase [Lysobacter sp. CAU 1642]MCK7595038.1 glycosyltransferase [Lysobacter sp. CAU 1642]